MILQSTGDDFRRRSRAAVYEDDQGFAFDQITGMGVEPLSFVGVASTSGNDFALLQERVCY